MSLISSASAAIPTTVGPTTIAKPTASAAIALRLTTSVATDCQEKYRNHRDCDRQEEEEQIRIRLQHCRLTPSSEADPAGYLIE
jgi:hypothetical protein